MKDYLENRAEVAGSLISRRNFMLAAATGGAGLLSIDMNQFTSRMG